jgi:hypothetical protein
MSVKKNQLVGFPTRARETSQNIQAVVGRSELTAGLQKD